MPIKNLRDGPPVTGFVKLGMTDKGKKGAPSKFDHLEITGMERDRDGNLIPNVDLMLRLVKAGARTCGGCQRSKQLADLCGIDEFANGLPTEIGIILSSNDIGLSFDHRMAYFRGKTAYCTGDLEEAKRLETTGHTEVNGKNYPVYGEPKRHSPCGAGCPDYDSGRCKPQAYLRFSLAGQQTIGTRFEFRTTSWNSIANIENALKEIALRSGGVLANVPLHFHVFPKTVNPKRTNAPANTAYVVTVEFRGTHQQLVEGVEQTLRLRAPLVREIKLLEATISRDWKMTDVDVDDFVAEFHPENLRDLTGGETETGQDGGEEDPAVSTQESPEPAPEAAKGSPPREAAPPPSTPVSERVSDPDPVCGECKQDPCAPDCSLGGEEPPPIGEPSPPEAGFEGDFEPMCMESKHQLWNACKAHVDHQEQARDCLRAVLDQFSYETSNEASEDQLHLMLLAVEKWGK